MAARCVGTEAEYVPDFRERHLFDFAQHPCCALTRWQFGGASSRAASNSVAEAAVNGSLLTPVAGMAWRSLSSIG